MCSRCWSSNLCLSPPSNARLEVTYKDRREAFGDFSTRSRAYAMSKRCRIQLLTTLSLLFISVICLWGAGEMCCYIARGRKRLFKDQAGLLWNSAEKSDTDPGQTKPHCSSPWGTALGWKMDEWGKRKKHTFGFLQNEFLLSSKTVQRKEDAQGMENVALRILKRQTSLFSCSFSSTFPKTFSKIMHWSIKRFMTKHIFTNTKQLCRQPISPRCWAQHYDKWELCARLVQVLHQMALSRSEQEQQLSWAREQEKGTGESTQKQNISQEASAKAHVMTVVLHQRSLLHQLWAKANYLNCWEVRLRWVEHNHGFSYTASLKPKYSSSNIPQLNCI